MLRVLFDHGLDGKVELSVGSEMELGGTSVDFYCPVFAHAHEAISREKGFIAVEARTTVELDQVWK
jgi:hypothetical protein